MADSTDKFRLVVTPFRVSVRGFDVLSLARMQKLAGMTGTARTEAQEFSQIYALEVAVVPTNVPTKRIDHADVVFGKEGGAPLQSPACACAVRRVHCAGWALSEPGLIWGVHLGRTSAPWLVLGCKWCSMTLQRGLWPDGCWGAEPPGSAAQASGRRW